MKKNFEIVSVIYPVTQIKSIPEFSVILQEDDDEVLHLYTSYILKVKDSSCFKWDGNKKIRISLVYWVVIRIWEKYHKNGIVQEVCFDNYEKSKKFSFKRLSYPDKKCFEYGHQVFNAIKVTEGKYLNEKNMIDIIRKFNNLNPNINLWTS